MSRRSIEPFVWLAFSVGGVVAALLIPVSLFLFGLAFPLGWVSPPDHARLLGVLGHPLTRVVLLVLCVLALFHWAHRFRYLLHDLLRLKHHDTVIRLFTYGGAVVGSVVVAFLVLLAL